jgi:hypothetical protein
MYDRGCDLVEAAMAIRRAALTSDITPAVPALLGCIECALDELADASAALSETPHAAQRRLNSSEVARRGATSGQVRQAFVNLETALEDARDAADAARAFASRARALAAGFDPSRLPPS